MPRIKGYWGITIGIRNEFEQGGRKIMEGMEMEGMNGMEWNGGMDL